MSSVKSETFIRPEQSSKIKPFQGDSESQAKVEPKETPEEAPEQDAEDLLKGPCLEEVVVFKAQPSVDNSIDSDEIEEALTDLRAAADESIGVR